MGTTRLKSLAAKVLGVAAVTALVAVASPVTGQAASRPPSIKLGNTTTATCQRTFPEVCLQPSPGNDIVARVDLGTNFTKSGQKVVLVCLNFTFDPANPLNPGEVIFVGGNGGAENIGTTDQLYRQLCFSDYDMNLLEEFQDGRTILHIYAHTGSFKLANVSVSYTAEPL